MAFRFEGVSAKRLWQVLATAILVLLGAVFVFSTAAYADEPATTVRVGYYERPPFQSGTSDEVPKGGYAYDYLQRLKLYNNWRCEYIYDSYDEFPSVEANSIFTEYLDYFWDKDDVYGEKLKKALTKAFMSKIARDYYTIKMKGNNFFRILKLSSKYAI